MSKAHKKYLKERLSILSNQSSLSLFDEAGLTSDKLHIISLYACNNNAKIYFLPTYMLEKAWNQSKNNRVIAILSTTKKEDLKKSTYLVASKVRCLGVCINNLWYCGEEARIECSLMDLKKKLFYSMIVYKKNKLNQ